jgi:hypothetical protein
MKVDALTPNEYWQTSAFDYELAVLVQNAVHAGREAGRAEMKQAEEDRKKLEREEAASMKRMMERAGKL